jgi:hypothetical protein
MKQTNIANLGKKLAPIEKWVPACANKKIFHLC